MQQLADGGADLNKVNEVLYYYACSTNWLTYAQWEGTTGAHVWRLCLNTLKLQCRHGDQAETLSNNSCNIYVPGLQVVASLPHRAGH